MFSVSYWFEKTQPHRGYYDWSRDIRTLLAKRPNTKVAIIEMGMLLYVHRSLNDKLNIYVLGCGKNVPTARYQCEDWLELDDFAPTSSVTLIRINPGFPVLDTS